MDEGKFWLSLWLGGFVMVMVCTAVIAVQSNDNSKNQYNQELAKFTACINGGGSWLDQRYEPACILRK